MGRPYRGLTGLQPELPAADRRDVGEQRPGPEPGSRLPTTHCGVRPLGEVGAFGVAEDSGWFRLSVGAVSLPEIERMLPRLREALMQPGAA